MKKSMDLLGQALKDRYRGEIFPFVFEVEGKEYAHDIDRYLRPVNKLSKIEKKMISYCRGDILDVGCGTGNYLPEIERMGKVIGIDISPKVIEVAKLMGRKNCVVGDIFMLDEKKTFDTITMFENNLGVGETVEGAKRLIKKVIKLLKANGQILIILSGRAKDKDYLQTDLIPIYRGIKGEPFKWITFNKAYLRKMCDELGLSLKVLSSNRYYSFVKITKK